MLKRNNLDNKILFFSGRTTKAVINAIRNRHRASGMSSTPDNAASASRADFQRTRYAANGVNFDLSSHKAFFKSPIIMLYLYKQKKIESTRLTAQGRLPLKCITKAMSCVLSKAPTTRSSHRLKASKGCRSRSSA